jgi:hypothetical protein
MKALTIAALSVALMGFVFFLETSAPVPARAAVAPSGAPRLTIYLASIIWKGPDGGLNTAAVFCSAADRDEAAEKMGATFKRKFPGATVLSLEANPIPDDLIDEVCASRRKPAI